MGSCVIRSARLVLIGCLFGAACTTGPAPTPTATSSASPPTPTPTATVAPTTAPPTSPAPTASGPAPSPSDLPSPPPAGPTGLGWEAIALPLDPAYQTVGVIDVTARDGQFLVAGVGWREDDKSVQLNEPLVWLSGDGRDWQLVDDLAWPGGHIDAIAAWQGQYVAAGRLPGERAQAAFWTSSDGRSWQQLPDAESFAFFAGIPDGRDIVAGGIADLRVEGDELVALGWLSCACPDQVREATIEWRTADGQSWQRTEGPPADAWQEPLPGGAGWLRIAPDGASVESSVDGTTWQTAWVPPADADGSVPTAQLFALRQHVGGYLAVGTLFRAGAGTPLAVSSVEGLSWQASAGWPDIDELAGTMVDVAATDDRLVAVGPAGLPPLPYAWLHTTAAAGE
jgi:hypothetical protein